MKRIPCTIAILTKNSASTLEPALKSAQKFAEILICDGGSTDDTLKLAHQYGARVIQQSVDFLDDDGSLIDFSGVRNQMLHAATYDWQFHLDSDELLTSELVEELASIVVADEEASYKVYMVPRKYTYKGCRIERSITYPAYQYRFYNRSYVTGFTKPVHERIRFDSEVRVGKLQNVQLVPVRSTIESDWSGKMQKYIAMEIAQNKDVTGLKRLQVIFILCKRVSMLFVRLFVKRLLRFGSKLPIAYDVMVIRYQWSILIGVLSKKSY